jgi:hypothetical protein
VSYQTRIKKNRRLGLRYIIIMLGEPHGTGN